MPIGKYILLEGGDGCGKTFHSQLVFEYLQGKGISCYLGREPGGVKSAEAMREILKYSTEDISPIGEVFGFEFARAEFFDKIVIPKLKGGITIISDRSGYSTLAYQGYAEGVDLEFIKAMNEKATRGISPDLAIFIDIIPEKGLEKEVVRDRFSARGIEYHNRVRQGYLDIAKENPAICRVISYIPNGAEEMQKQIRSYVDLLFI